jgi:hypothetical protein
MRPAGRAHDGGEVMQHTYPTHEEFQAFRRKGLSLIDLGEYVDLVRRFGSFDEARTLSINVPTFEAGASDRHLSV